MKNFIFIIWVVMTGFPVIAQPFIHSHNDYEQANPLTHAVDNKAFSIEADVYLTSLGLVVTHELQEIQKGISTAPTLDSLYLQPIIRFFKKYHGRISKDKSYTPVLMIDIKEKGPAVIAALIKLVATYPFVFDRSVNPLAVQLVVSGDRGPASVWSTYPSFILFDGRPFELYDSAALSRVGFISDVYFKYVTKTDSSSKIEQVVKKVHEMGKLLRLWAIPDHAVSWGLLQRLGVDIINTDKVKECKDYFLKPK
ncbi:MAG: glycerophosphodiester phosphodiesterase [Bacteroidota bacterium]